MTNSRTRKATTPVCPIRYALDIIGGKWKLAILCMLLPDRIRRYGEIKRKLGTITNMMLAQSLKELESDGIVLRKQYNEVPPRVEYSLTDEGKTLYDALHLFAHWGQDHMLKHTDAVAYCDVCTDGMTHEEHHQEHPKKR